jgi:DNA-binding NarL/FixJ family response regulator
VLTTYSGDVQVLRAMKTGARAFLLKSYETLTPAEVDVLRLIAAGNANKQIAAQLSITEETVKGRVKNILAKLGANDRTHAAMIGIKRGIIEP